MAASARAERLPSLQQTLGKKGYRQLKKAHPGNKKETYHNFPHTENVYQGAVESTYRRALARGLSEKEALRSAVFMGQVAALHDADPWREPGSRPSAHRTIKLLERDFSGKGSIVTGKQGSSFAKEVLGWGPEEVDMAVAIIQRSEFPFADEHPYKAYQKQYKGKKGAARTVASGSKKSPVLRYELALAKLSQKNRDFVLREAPLFSEYADKASMYSTRDFDFALRSTKGLITELGNDGIEVGYEQVDPGAFIATLGQPENLAIDQQLIKKFGSSVSLPTRKEFMAHMSPEYRARLKATQKSAARLGELYQQGMKPKQAERKARALYESELRRQLGQRGIRKKILRAKNPLKKLDNLRSKAKRIYSRKRLRGVAKGRRKTPGGGKLLSQVGGKKRTRKKARNR
jgi:hypothetical protein